MEKNQLVNYFLFQATKSATKCLIISLILYFLHLMTSVWLCLYCFYIYKRFSTGGIIRDHHLKVKYFNIAAYDIPTFFTLVRIFSKLFAESNNMKIILKMCELNSYDYVFNHFQRSVKTLTKI